MLHAPLQQYIAEPGFCVANCDAMPGKLRSATVYCLVYLSGVGDLVNYYHE